MRARDRWMAVVGVALALLSIALIAFGQGTGRLGGLALLLVAAGGLTMPVSGRLAARSGIRPELGRVEHDGTLQPALVIPGSAIKLRLMRLGIACFAALGLMLAIWPRELGSHEASGTVMRIAGIAIVVVLGGLVVLRQLYVRGPQRIALLSSGLRWELGAGPSYVAWDDVIGARTYDNQGAWQLAIETRRGSRRDPPRLPWQARLERAVSHPGSTIPLEAFPVDPQRLAAVVRGCAAEPALRKDVASEGTLAWLTGQEDSAGSLSEPSAAREILSGVEMTSCCPSTRVVR